MASNRSSKLPWEALSVRHGSGPDLAGGERLAVLVRWLRSEGSPEDQFLDPDRTRTLADPMDVNWARFPVQEALDAAATPTQRSTAPQAGKIASSWPPAPPTVRDRGGTNGTTA
jgi:hypothetical protein